METFQRTESYPSAGARSLSSALALLCTVFCGASSELQAGTIHVPADQPTIQAGIDASVPGDVVLVEPGTYFESITFRGKAITVASADGPTATIIDGGSAGPVVNFGSGEGTNSVLRGFRIQHGYWNYGSGATVILSSPTIVGNIFQYNASPAGWFGAAIGGWAAAPIVEQNLFRNNSADDQTWAGAVCFVGQSSPFIANNIFAHNSCRGLNFALASNSPVVLNNTFVSNRVAVAPTASGFYCNNLLVGNGIGVESPFGGSYFAGWSNNLVFGGQRYVNIADQTGTNGNLSAQPLLACPQSDDFHVLSGSPCIDAGNSLVSNSLSTDFEGNPRTLDGDGDGQAVIDIGAFEFNAAAPPMLCVYISCPSNVTVLGDAGTSSVVVDFPLPEVSPGATVTCTPPPGSAFPAGTNAVLCVAVYGTNSAACTFTVTVLIRPLNDDFEHATVILSLPYTNLLDATGATPSANDPWCPHWGYGTGPSVWYKFTPSQDTDVLCDSSGSDYSVYVSGCVSLGTNLGQVSCGAQSTRFTAYAGFTYYIMADAERGTPSGHLHLSVQAGLPFELGLSADSLATFDARAHTVTLGGTVASTRPTFVGLWVTLRQERGSGRVTENQLQLWVPCASSAPWTVTFWDPNGTFRGGPAQVSLSGSGFDTDTGEYAFHVASTNITIRGAPP